MGYTTTFDGSVGIEPPLNPQEIEYLNKFANTRHMNRGDDPYHVDEINSTQQWNEPDILDPEQPALWCQWVPTDNGASLVWNEGEKFYDPEQWMDYLIDHFLTGTQGNFRHHPDSAGFTFNHVVNGTFLAQGEEPGDVWCLVVKDNQVIRVSA